MVLCHSWRLLRRSRGALEIILGLGTVVGQSRGGLGVSWRDLRAVLGPLGASAMVGASAVVGASGGIIRDGVCFENARRSASTEFARPPTAPHEAEGQGRMP